MPLAYSGVYFAMKLTLILSAGLLTMITGCATVNPPPTVEKVDLPRFMGDWYVISGIFTVFEKGAHNAIERYELDDKGRIQTTFTFNKDSLTGPLKSFPSVAFIHNKETFAEWRIQFFWPFRFPYLVIFLDEDYQATAVSTDDKKYLWIMSRTPQMPEPLYRTIMEKITELGFDTNKIVTVPQARN